jgi:riboflavin synthase alpha subunit
MTGQGTHDHGRPPTPPTPPEPPGARPRRRLPRGAASALVLLAGCLTTVTGAALAVAPQAKADTVPPAPTGWTTVFGDNFAGAANSPPASSNWFYDIGTGYGTGEKEQTTNSTSNIFLDGGGHMVLKAINNGGTWTSARIESTRDDFQAPPGGKLEMTASIQQPSPANGTGYWPAFWALGAPMRTGGGWPQSGEIDMMEDVNGSNQASQTLHDSAGSSGHALIACPNTASTCQTGYHTYSVIIDRTSPAETLQFLMDGTVESTITEASVGTSAWQQAIDHGFFIIFDLAMGGNYPDPLCGCTSPTSATTSGGAMSVGYVAVYEQGGNSTPTGTPSATGQVTGINGLCLGNQNSLNTAGNPIGVATCNGSAGQQWSAYSDNTVRVQGGCLDVVSAGTTSGTNVDWYPCNATNAQGWTPAANGELVNPSSGLCLTDPGGNTGARLDIENCTGAASQTWTGPSGGGGGNTVTVTSPGNQAGTVGTAASVQVHASDSAAGQTLSYGASGLPAGLSINSSTGLISGTPTAAGTSTVTVTARDGTGASGTSAFSWAISSGGGGSCGAANAALNQATTASSTENAGTPASAATDGNPGTRWSSAFADPQWLEVDLGASQSVCGVTLNWEAAYGKSFQVQVSADNANWTTIYSTTTGTGGVQALTALSGTGRYLRVYGTVRATQYGYSLWELQVFTTGAGGGSCGTANAALNQATTASSTENAGTPASAATDGNPGTRWSSAFADPQWLEVDLGASQSVCGVTLNWEAAYGKSFQVQVSADNANWTTIYSTTTGTGGVQALTALSGTGRYLRVYGTARATQYGYSLWELQVFTR